MQQEEEPQGEEAPQLGTVSGVITDASTGNPIPEATVRLLDQMVETGVDGAYAFRQVDYADALNLTITAADYEFQTQGFALQTEGLLLDIHLIPLAKPEDDIRLALDMLSGLIASRDLNNLAAIQAHFSEAYLAANDRVTQFGLATGVIPADFDGIIPAQYLGQSSRTHL
jgi:hypothetical protein